MLVRYKVRYWSEINEDEAVDAGIVSGETIGAAANTVNEWYGKDNVFELTVSECEEVLCDEELRDIISQPLNA